MFRIVTALGLAALLPGLSPAQPAPTAAQQKSALMVGVIERMDRRLDDVNHRIVAEFGELRSVQKEMLAELKRLDRQVASLDARLAALESKPTPPPAAAPVQAASAKPEAKADVVPVKFVPPAVSPPAPPAAAAAPTTPRPTQAASPPVAPPPWPGQPCVVFFVPYPPAR